jgi:hypothetical protein
VLEILGRFLNVVGCINACCVSDETLEILPLPAEPPWRSVLSLQTAKAPSVISIAA